MVQRTSSWERRDERGSMSLAQVVITAPALLFLLMLIVQFGLMFHARNVAEQAAQVGQRGQGLPQPAAHRIHRQGQKREQQPGPHGGGQVQEVLQGVEHHE